MQFLREAMFVDGSWIAADDGASLSVTDPATGTVIGTVPAAGVAETRRAIAAAHATFQHYGRTGVNERSELLRNLAELVRSNSEALAQLLTLEQGKPLAEARGEIAMSANYILWFAEEARRAYGDIIPSPWPSRQLLVTHAPIGVVGAITPWNFPSSMLARKIGPALAAGCTLVVKPAPQTPYSGLAWGVLCEMAGFPKGSVNILTGPASAIGGELTRNPLLRKITFTGSTSVGKLVLAQAAETVKRVSMELGGNAPYIVFDDADLDAAVEGALLSKFRNSGQTCICSNRFYVQSGIYNAFIKKFADATAALKVGSGFVPDVSYGPLIDENAVARVENLVADAVQKGGAVITGGGRHSLGGNFFEATVIAKASPDMAVAQEEVFGPVAPVFRFKTESEVVAQANSTEHGLACYFYTNDLSRIFRMADELQYGIIGINEGLVTTEVAPFGGLKQSGIGREGGKGSVFEYLEQKYLSIGGIAQKKVGSSTD